MSASAAPPAGAAGEWKDATAGATTTTTPYSLLPLTATNNDNNNNNNSSTTHDDDGNAALSAQAYLEKTVMGVLALALEDVCRVRPINPVDYLGSYLLRRSSANNTVEVTYEDTLSRSVHVDDDDA